MILKIQQAAMKSVQVFIINRMGVFDKQFRASCDFDECSEERLVAYRGDFNEATKGFLEHSKWIEQDVGQGLIFHFCSELCKKKSFFEIHPNTCDSE